MRQADGEAIFALWRNNGLAIRSEHGRPRPRTVSAGSRKVASKHQQPKKGRDREAPTRRQRRVAVDQPVSGAIGAQLRALYDKIAQQPLPDRFERLLRRLGSSNDN